MKEKTLKLFRVYLKGPCGYDSKLNPTYVIAEDPTTAYRKVRELLDTKDWCFVSARELDKIELIAEANFYTESKAILLL